jgi:hypothetical protein
LLKFLQYEVFPAYVNMESDGISPRQLISGQDTECGQRKEKQTKLIEKGESHGKTTFTLWHSDCDSDTQFSGANKCC